MKQVLQSYRTGELWLADVAPPNAAPLGARVRTRASLVSAGTEKAVMALAKKSLVGKARARPDLVRRVLQKARQEGIWATVEQVRQKLEVPIPMGYSAAGVIEDAVDCPGLAPGMRVAIAGAGYAAHAEMNWVPRNLIVPLPAGVSFAEGACATVGSIALQGVRKSEIRLGDRVVVIGMGLIGNLCAQLAAASGARVFAYDLSKDKVALGIATGCSAGSADPATVVDEVLAFSDGHGADTVIIAASASGNSQPMQLAVDLARLGGKIVVVGDVGMDVPRNEAYTKELEVRLSMSYGPGRYDATYEERGQDYPYAHVRYTEQRNLQSFLEAVEDGRVDLQPLLTHSFGIDQALDAYTMLQTGSEPYIGVVLTYGDSDDPELQLPSAPRPASSAASRAATSVRKVSGRVGIGMIGAGSYMRSQLLGPLKQADVDLVGVVNRTGASAKLAEDEGGFSWSSTDADRLFEDPSVHAVFIGTRHRLHAEMTIRALKAGKHVFVEKPLTLSEAELAEVARVQAETGLYIQVGTNRRHSPYTTAVHEAFGHRADPLAITYRINAGRIPKDHWLRDPDEGGGRIIGEGVHFVDWCQAAVGQPITRVIAVPGTGGPTSLPEDTFCCVLTFADGSLATILYAADGSRALEKERIEVFGLGQSFTIDNWTAGKHYSGAGSKSPKVGRGMHKGVPEQIAAFVQSIRTGTPVVPVDVTLHVQHATLAAAATFADGIPREVSWPRPGAASDDTEAPAEDAE